MFIDAKTVYAREIEPLARIADREGQRGGFIHVHSAEIDRHAERGGLIIGNFPRNVKRDEMADLLLREDAAVTLLADNVIHAHR